MLEKFSAEMWNTVSYTIILLLYFSSICFLTLFLPPFRLVTMVSDLKDEFKA